ncbi:MAG: hypothetical protein AB9891_17995 [Anaerolineaceae bacterium]
MTIALLALSFLISWLIGLSLVILCFRESVLENLILKVFLGMGTGIGVTSSLYFFWSILFNPSQRAYFFVEGFVLTLLLFLVFRDQSRRNHPRISIEKKPLLQFFLIIVLSVVFFAALWAAADVFFKLTLSEPHGRYDAWAIWDYRARFIYRGGDYWLDAVSPLQFHPDYPLLTPLSISRTWLFMNDEVQKGVIFLAGLFTFGSIGLIASAVSSMKKLPQGLLAAFVLASTGTFVYNGTLLFADVPQAFFILSAVVLAYLAFTRAKEKPGLAVLAGLNAAYCGWVKNEGLMFFAVSAAVILVFYFFILRKKTKAFIWNYLAGVALPLATILYFKTLLSPQNDLVNPQNLTTLFEKIIDPSRYQVIYQETTSYLLAFGNWTFPILVLLVGYAVIAYSNGPRENQTGRLAVILMVLFQIAGYIAIYLITPFDLTLHIRQSILRLIVHIYPAFLFILFLLIKSPEEILSTFVPANKLEQKKSDQTQ